jgi:hypothetical protein
LFNRAAGWLSPARAVGIRALPAAERRHVVAAGPMINKAD